MVSSIRLDRSASPRQLAPRNARFRFPPNQRNRRILGRTFLIAAFWLAVISAVASPAVAQSEQQKRDLFETTIRPTLVKDCLTCHDQKRQEGGLVLTTRAGLMAGGDSGPAVIAGHPDESLLLEAIGYQSLEMPPDAPLDDETIDAFQRWIHEGAVWPATEPLRPVTRDISDSDRQWWCLQPVRRPAIPEVKQTEWCRNEIDFFVLAELENHGIAPGPIARPDVLSRRLNFAITGLPPANDQAGLSDTAPDPVQAFVDRLLDHPGYGENQARHWLDLVRYADSDGYRADHKRPHAHQYRNYVIDSFRQDRPYDQFLTQQLAGDETEPSNREALIATMYLRHWIYEHNQRDVEGQWQEILDDITETTADAFLALGLKCARCHDHKFDPLLQEDYFRLKAFFAPLLPREDQPVATPTQQQQYREALRHWQERSESLRESLREIEQPVLLKHATREGFEKFVPEIKAMLLKWDYQRTPYEHQIASLARRQYDLLPEKLPEWLDPETEARRQQLRKQLSALEELKPKPLPVQPFVVSDVGRSAPATRIPDAPDRSPVAPGFPTLLDPDPAEIPEMPAGLESTGRRTALARWMTRETNPLTARVLVNRIWQQHFGVGLVENASDFGHLTAPPSHPALLDWLAWRFMQDGWSIKKLHRRILTSATYLQTSVRSTPAAAIAHDPENRLLWKMRPRRLSAEEISDTIMMACGETGPGQRSIYQPVMRNDIPARLQLFDFPDRIRSCAQRHRTTTAPQALHLMNGQWIHQRVNQLADKLQGNHSLDWLDGLYRQLFFRSPESWEVDAAQRFLEQYRTITDDTPIPRTAPMQVATNGPSTQDGDVNRDAAADVAVGLWFPKDSAPQVTASAPQSSHRLVVEAIVRLDSLYDDATVRTIAGRWSGKTSEVGWSLGVTSRKSSFEPANLILQLVGRDSSQKTTYEVLASDLRVPLHRPVYVAVAVDLQDTSPQGVRFWLQDLSDGSAERQTAAASHQVVEDVIPSLPIQIGGRPTGHYWHGSIHRVRLATDSLEPVGSERLLQTVHQDASASLDVRALPESPWMVELGSQSSGVEVLFAAPQIPGRELQARRALIHSLLNSNEMIYVD